LGNAISDDALVAAVLQYDVVFVLTALKMTWCHNSAKPLLKPIRMSYQSQIKKYFSGKIFTIIHTFSMNKIP